MTQEELARAFARGATEGEAANMRISGASIVSTHNNPNRAPKTVVGPTPMTHLAMHGDFGRGIRLLVSVDGYGHGAKIAHQLEKVENAFGGKTNLDEAPWAFRMPFYALAKVYPTWARDGIEIENTYLHKHVDQKTQRYGAEAQGITRTLLWRRDHTQAYLLRHGNNEITPIDAVDLAELRILGEDFEIGQQLSRRARNARKFGLSEEFIQTQPIDTHPIVFALGTSPDTWHVYKTDNEPEAILTRIWKATGRDPSGRALDLDTGKELRLMLSRYVHFQGDQ